MGKDLVLLARLFLKCIFLACRQKMLPEQYSLRATGYGEDSSGRWLWDMGRAEF